MTTIPEAEALLWVASFAFFWFEVSNVSVQEFRTYYEANKSRISLAPPGWFFGVAWAAWKIMIWFAFCWYVRYNAAVRVDILAIWIINEVARKYWTYFFMDLRQRRIALADCAVVFGTALTLMILLGIHGHLLSCLLLLGYTGWTLVACLWNWQWIWKNVREPVESSIRQSRLR